MNKPFRPEGYNTVSPYLIADGARQLIDMLAHVFNAKEKRRYDRPDGRIMHVEVQIDDSVIMLADATDQFPAYQLWMHVYVADVDGTFEKAVSYGCQPVEAPTQKEGDPDRRGTFKDAAGNHWSIASQQN